MCIWIFKCVCACICLHVYMSYLRVHLRHWAAGYAALKGCVSAAIPPSFPPSASLSPFFFLLTLFSSSVLSVRLHHAPSLSSVHLCSIIGVSSLDKTLRGPPRSTLCCLRAKLVSSGSSESIIKLFMQRVWPLTISLLFEASWGVYVYAGVCVCVCRREETGRLGLSKWGRPEEGSGLHKLSGPASNCTKHFLGQLSREGGKGAMT